MSSNPCKITGCILVDEANDRAVVGDLFQYGSAWVFNANVWPDGKEANWQPAAGIPNTAKQLTLSRCNDNIVFERRGVIVIEQGPWAQLNPVAVEYLK